MFGKIDLVAAMMRACIANVDMEPSEFMTAVHNVFVHGDVLIEAGYNFTDEQLGELFAGFETSIQVLRNIEEG